MSSWDPLQRAGISYRLFEDHSARAFIADELTDDHVAAFERCHHPAMRSDYFRLCYIHVLGGLYIDADDVMQQGDVSGLFDGGCLKVRPLCYDIVNDTMVDVEAALGDCSRLKSRIFYFNNNPLAAPAGHPIVGYALQRATRILMRGGRAIADIQSTTGPGNVTASLVRHHIISRAARRGRDFKVLMNWDDLAMSIWPLSYRDDDRNWRRWQPDVADVPPWRDVGAEAVGCHHCAGRGSTDHHGPSA